MNKFCKLSLCVEKVCDSYVLISRRVVDVPGSVEAIRLTLLLLIAVKLRLCYKLFADWPLELENKICMNKNAEFPKTGFFVPARAEIIMDVEN